MKSYSPASGPRRTKRDSLLLPKISRRDLIRGVAGLSVASAFAGCSLGDQPGDQNLRPSATGRRDWIVRENELPGTRDWLLQKTQIDPKTKYRCPWIEGFCSHTSIRAGETLSIFVSTNPPSPFTIDLYRMGFYAGTGGRHRLTLGPLPGKIQLEPDIGNNRLRECRWEPAARLRIPNDWLSGVYLGKLTAEKEGLQSYIIFIVRDDRLADFLFQCSDTTWQAYNRWPNQFSLYDDGKDVWYWGPEVAVSFLRPYGKYCQILDAPLSTGSGEWFLWEFPVAYWLESQGFDLTYVSNVDTHADGKGLLRAKGFLSVGHDEYYSIEMFNHLRTAIDSGLNVAFLSGNTCCGRIEFHKSFDGGLHRNFERVDAFGPPDPEDIKRLPTMGRLPHRSPNSNLLVGARNLAPFTGGGDWICSAPDHWIFQGTGMKQGEGIPGLVGWEWHGDPATKPGLIVVSTGSTDNQSEKGAYTATLYPGPRNNFVFNASTCWWGDGLSAPPGYLRPAVYTKPQGPDPRVRRITTNLLRRMSH